MDTTGMATAVEDITRLDDLPESCVAHVLAFTSPRNACRCAAVSPSFRDAAESDAVWERFLPPDYRALLLRASSGRPPLPPSSKKDAYLRLSDSAVMVGDGGDTAVWLARGSGAKFAEVAQLVGCTDLDIYGRLPVSALTPATDYAAFLVFGVADEGHSGLSFPDQEATVAVGGRPASRHAVCLRPDDHEAREFRGVVRADGVGRRPARRDDGWSEMEMGRLRVDESTVAAEEEEEEVVSFDVFGWQPKRGIVVEGVEFRPL